MGETVAIVTPFFYGIGGAETFCQALQADSKKQNSTMLITIADKADRWQGTPFIKSIVICFRLLVQMIRGYARAADVYHAQGLMALAVCVVYNEYFSLTRKPVFVTMLALYDFKTKPGLFKFLCRNLLNRADKIFVEGETGRKDLLDCGVKENKIIIFYHWVDLEKFKPIERNWPELRILYVARPIRIKGKHVVKYLERKFHDNENIKFKYIESCPYSEIVKEYQNADILIVPSQYSEGFPRVVFEAAACGCVILASDRGSLPELVHHFGHIEEYEQWIRLYSVSKHALKLVQESSRKYAEKFFSPDNAKIITSEYSK